MEAPSILDTLRGYFFISSRHLALVIPRWSAIAKLSSLPESCKKWIRFASLFSSAICSSIMDLFLYSRTNIQINIRLIAIIPNYFDRDIAHPLKLIPKTLIKTGCTRLLAYDALSRMYRPEYQNMAVLYTGLRKYCRNYLQTSYGMRP